MKKNFTTTLEKSDCLEGLDEPFCIKEQILPYGNPAQNLTKRSTDVVISLLVLAFLFSWLYPILFLLIKADSKGPVFFKQLRHGKGNVPFYCYKFRTMVINDEADTKQATKNDPRVTKIGTLLRKTCLDELPQILNVIRGEMSIVGPRPHPIMLNERFSKEICNLMSRHIIKPGITGLAQAKGFIGEIGTYYDMNSRLKLDLFYVKNWSFLLDIKIIFWTVSVLILGRKS